MPASAIEVDTSPTARTAVFIGGVGPHYAMLADAAVHRQLVNAGVTGLYQHANGNASLTPAQRSALWTTWHVGQPGNLGTIAEIGASSAGDPGYLAFFGGSYPAQVNMNSLEDDADKGSYIAAAGDAHPGKVYRLITSPAGLLRMQRAINQAHAHGARDVAVFITPNGGFEDLDDQFATSAYWATVRTAASYGGGIAIDTPPSYWVARGPGYQSFIVQMVEWANAKGLRSSVTVSPYALTADASGHSGGCGFDPGFHDNTKLLVSMLRKDHAMPEQWVVENYGLAGTGCGTENDVQAGDAANSLNAVAAYLACVTKPSVAATAGPVQPDRLAVDGSSLSAAHDCQ